MTTETPMQCEHCGMEQGDRFTCCGEQDWVPSLPWQRDGDLDARIEAAIEAGMEREPT